MPEIVLEAQKWNELIFALFGVIRSIRILYVIFFITI
jgi:hypothetical protein